MVMVYIKQLEKEVYLDGYIRDNLDDLRRAVALKWDGALLYTGMEGDGKTTMCSQNLAYLDPSFTIARVCFNLKQVKALVHKLPPGSAIQYDESRKDTTASGNLENQKEFIKIMTENRNKGLYWGIVSSTFFDMKKYFAIHRTRVLINIYARNLERGFFEFYDRQKKQNLYIRGRKDWNWQIERPNFRGRFTSWLPFSEEEYNKKKNETIAEEEESDPEWPKTREGKRYIITQQLRLVKYLQTNQWITKRGPLDESIASFLHCSTRSLTEYRKDLSFAVANGLVEGDVPVFDPQRRQENDDTNLDDEGDDAV